MFFILGISIAVFLEFLLLIKKDKSRADKILMIWLLLIVIHQLFHYWHFTGDLYNYPHLLGIEFPLPILHGVLLYFYVLEITGKKVQGVGLVLAHLSPTIIITLLAIPFYSLTGEEKVAVFENEAKDYMWYVYTQNVVVALSGFVYSILSWLRIRKHKSNIQDNFSNTEKKELQWLKFLAFGLAMIWVIVIFANDTIIFSVLVVFVLCIGIFGINQLSIFYPNQPSEIASIAAVNSQLTEEPPAPPTKVKRYAKSGLNETSAEQLYTRLIQLMEEESLYIKNDLTLTELAKRLEVHSNNLSQVINAKEQKNFYNYINALRIQEFIRRYGLPENKNFTLLSVAYVCGFNSKSTFNKHFKENTGKTPTEYFG